MNLNPFHHVEPMWDMDPEVVFDGIVDLLHLLPSMGTVLCVDAFAT